MIAQQTGSLAVLSRLGNPWAVVLAWFVGFLVSFVMYYALMGPRHPAATAAD